MLVSHHAAGGAAIYDATKYCHTAEDKQLCAQMVAGAQTLRDASEKAIKATMDYAKKIEGESGAIIPSVRTLPPETRKSIVATCKESFENAVDDLQLSLQALMAHDQGTLMTRLSAALESDCEDAVNEFGANFPLQKDMKRYNAELDSALAVVTQE